jgi:hypothetical protein
MLGPIPTKPPSGQRVLSVSEYGSGSISNPELLQSSKNGKEPPDASAQDSSIYRSATIVSLSNLRSIRSDSGQGQEARGNQNETKEAK